MPNRDNFERVEEKSELILEIVEDVIPVLPSELINFNWGICFENEPPKPERSN